MLTCVSVELHARMLAQPVRSSRKTSNFGAAAVETAAPEKFFPAHAGS